LVVSDATPLIYLARIGRIQLLKNLFQHIQVPNEVKVEVVDRGKEKNYPDAYVIEEAFNEGWITLGNLTRNNEKKASILVEAAGIDIGEAEAIMLTRQKAEETILMDQAHARTVARQFGLKPKGTLYLIVVSARRGMLSKQDAKEDLSRLVEANFRISTKIYDTTLRAIEKL